MFPAGRQNRLLLAMAVSSISLATISPAAFAGPPNTTKGAIGADKLALNSTEGIDAELKAAMATAPTIEKYPNSNYARLLDIGNVTVKSDGTIVARYRIAYKLFNERARDLAEVNLPYNSSYQEMHVVSARTIKKDGKIIPVKKEDMRVSSPYSEYLMYDDAHAQSFSMPAIEDECIIDYTWEEITHPLLMPGQFWTYWGFSGLEPVGITRYVLKVPVEKKIEAKVYNDDTLKPTIVNSIDGKFKTYTWERKNLNPIEPEPGMPRLSEVSSWMEVSSLGTWDTVASWFWGLQQPQAKSTKAIQATVTELLAGKKTDDDKARAIYDWVANRTRYVGLEFGLSAYRPHAASEVHDKRYGDCKDKANLLITMLGLAGIKANPVLLHADERREVGKGLPTLNAFNHCIALANVSGKEVWLDATAETCAYGDIPYSDRGVQGFVVSGGKGEFKTIPFYQPTENGIEVKMTVSLQPDGSAEVRSGLTMQGESGQGMRARVRSLTPKQRKEMAQGMAQRLSNGASMKTFEMPDGSDKTGLYAMRMVSAAPNYAQSAGNLLIVPIGSGPASNPFTQEKRVFPIVEEDASMTRSITILNIPDGYLPEGIPEDVDLKSAMQEFKRSITKSADGKSLTILTEVIQSPGRIPASEFESVKKYYDGVVKVSDQKIVLKKK